MSVQVDISHNYSALQGLLQNCKVYWGHNSMHISRLVYPSNHPILQYFFRSTSIVKSIWELFPPRIIFPEYACLKSILLIHAPHIRRDHITIWYIFKSLYYFTSSTTLTHRIYEIFSSSCCTQFSHFLKETKLNSQVYQENGDVRSIYLFWQFSYIKRPYQRSVIQYQFLNFTSPW